VLKLYEAGKPYRQEEYRPQDDEPARRASFLALLRQRIGRVPREQRGLFWLGVLILVAIGLKSLLWR